MRAMGALLPLLLALVAATVVNGVAVDIAPEVPTSGSVARGVTLYYHLAIPAASAGKALTITVTPLSAGDPDCKFGLVPFVAPVFF